MDVVVVESPAKAKTINKYLGADFRVLASYGHVRDLPERDDSVRPDEDFAIDYEPLEEKKRRVEEIVQALKGAGRLVLATDPDREGEAISWHLLELLKAKKALKGVEVERVVFHEVTKPAVLEAMRHGRRIDGHLVDAYQARRALDYLVGFRLSPILWRKLQGSKSAGRVQSVALRLICEREAEIEAFVTREYWTVEASLRTRKGEGFGARLTHLDGKKLDRFDLAGEADAKRAVAAIEARDLAVAEVEKKQVSRNPAPPFSTSTLQQEASRKLGFSADRTMRTAQRLFEGVDLGGETVGLITYMRTDSVNLSGEAINACRGLIGERFGERYLPGSPRQFKTKAKNAQEAHEAIRPTDVSRLPKEVAAYLEDDQRRLYELVWKRTVASQMAAALLDRVTADITSPDGQVRLRATGQTVAFDGFIKLYTEGRDDRPKEGEEDDEESRILPPLNPGDPLVKEKVTPSQHFTEPPPRFTEASLVKRMEELGIGRPSTYASIISVLQNREYVRLESKRFVPEDRGRLVTAFLTSFFDRYVQPGFTAELEGRLDGVAAGEVFWKEVLRDFWTPFNGALGEVGELRVTQVIDALNEALAARAFPPRADGGDPRICPVCGTGNLSLKLGRFGAFVGCSNYPECAYRRKFGEGPEAAAAQEANERALGQDPTDGQAVLAKNGRFGPYVQRGTGDGAKRCSLPPGVAFEAVDLELALRLLALPREVGRDRETNEPILAGIGKFGPYVQRAKQYVNLPEGEDVLTISDNRAISLLADGSKRGRGGAASKSVILELGAHPDDGEAIQVLAGRFGPYVKHGKVNATLPKSIAPEAVSLGEALGLLAEKVAKGGGGKPGPRGRAKPFAKKPATAAGKAGAKTAAGAVKAAKPAAKTAAKPATAGPRKRPPRVVAGE